MFRVISYSFTEDVIKRDCEAAELALKQGNLPVSLNFYIKPFFKCPVLRLICFLSFPIFITN